MKKTFFYLLLLPFTALKAFEIPDEPMDQYQLFLVAPMYVLTKGVELAKENNCRYFKILSYEFHGHKHCFQGMSDEKPKKKKLISYQDNHIRMEMIGFKNKGDDPYIIDVKQYQEINDLFEES